MDLIGPFSGSADYSPESPKWVPYTPASPPYCPFSPILNACENDYHTSYHLSSPAYTPVSPQEINYNTSYHLSSPPYAPLSPRYPPCLPKLNIRENNTSYPSDTPVSSPESLQSRLIVSDPPIYSSSAVQDSPQPINHYETPVVSDSRSPVFSKKNSQSRIAFGQSSNQSNIDHVAQSDTEEIQPEDAQQKSSNISPTMDASVLSNKKRKHQESDTNSLVKVSRILKDIPQSPHFYPLRTHSNYARTFLISAWDRIFEEVFEQIQSLKENDFWIKCRELWKTMEELQSLGYNVIPLRRRLVELSDVTREVKFRKVGIKRLKMKAENHRAEKSRLEYEILKLQSMIRNEEDGMDSALKQVGEMEKELPKIDDVFVKILREPLNL